jgi:hypothetical protein
MTNKQHGGRRAGAGRRAGPPTKVVRLPVKLAPPGDSTSPAVLAGRRHGR